MPETIEPEVVKGETASQDYNRRRLMRREANRMNNDVEHVLGSKSAARRTNRITSGEDNTSAIIRDSSGEIARAIREVAGILLNRLRYRKNTSQ